MTLVYELLSACVADSPVQKNKKFKKFRKGYDARHRAALRLLATWLDIKWIKMEAIEIIVACVAMAAAKEEEEKSKEEGESPKSNWEKWNRGEMIGAGALSGGTLLATTGGTLLQH